ncbi:hypothetical protein PC116_g9628 [Phytophthora cactorum]|nr:hypothetical protein PC123_g23177 [Phytophthora cactorum]KAG4242482.1 hypothetical protein PC116_g9628 [Phytophthora cactorum]
MFFDGGSSGNPGPGGCGAVIGKIATTAAATEVCWIASIPHAHKSTTNNLAATGLPSGLRTSWMGTGTCRGK